MSPMIIFLVGAFTTVLCALFVVGTLLEVRRIEATQDSSYERDSSAGLSWPAGEPDSNWS